MQSRQRLKASGQQRLLARKLQGRTNFQKNGGCEFAVSTDRNSETPSSIVIKLNRLRREIIDIPVRQEVRQTFLTVPFTAPLDRNPSGTGSAKVPRTIGMRRLECGG